MESLNKQQKDNHSENKSNVIDDDGNGYVEFDEKLWFGVIVSSFDYLFRWTYYSRF